MILIEKHRKYLLKFINHIGQTDYENLSVVPIDVYMFVKDYDYITIVSPFIKIDIKAGLSINQIRIKYSISYTAVRTIGQKYGLYSCAKV